MKNLHVLSLAVAATLASTIAFAQSAAPNKPAKGDRVITREQAAKLPWLASRFDELDKNKDGKLSGDELPMRREGMRRHRGGMGMMSQHRSGMHLLDADHDGRISRAEVDAFAARFDQLDANKDGYLDRADMQLRMRQQRDALFTSADANKDGKLTRDEFAAAQRARFAERAEKFAKRAGTDGKTFKAPSEAERSQRMGAMFDRLDADKDGVLTRAEWDAAKPMRGPGEGRGMMRHGAKQAQPSKG